MSDAAIVSAMIAVGVGIVGLMVWSSLRDSARRREKDDTIIASLMGVLMSVPEFNLGKYRSNPCSSHGVVLAVNKESDALVVAWAEQDGKSADTRCPTKYKRFEASDILSAEVMTDTRSNVSMIGVTADVGDVPVGLLLGGISTTASSAWLKLLVRDIHCPWIMVPMPDVQSAQEWCGIAMIVCSHAPKARVPADNAA